MIEIQGAIKSYPNSPSPAVNNISMTIPSGTISVLIGPSGCGKTTTMRLINRMVELTAGRVLIDGDDITQVPHEALRKRIGYVIQSVALFPHMNVEENILIVPRLLKWKKQKCADRATELLELIGLKPHEYRHKYPQQLSGGEAQRIGVARALAAGQKILLMDEPFGAVDPLRREVLQREFIELQQKLKKTVLFVTHDLDEAIRLADTIVIMKDGKIIQKNTPEKLLAVPKNRFVRDFIGEDRALKRLGCFRIVDYMQPAHTILKGDEQKAPRTSNNTYWIVDKNNILHGMVKITGDTINPVAISAQSLALRENNSLKEGLSRALGLGISAVPIVNEQNSVIGEIRLSDIERINQSGLKY